VPRRTRSNSAARGSRRTRIGPRSPRLRPGMFSWQPACPRSMRLVGALIVWLGSKGLPLRQARNRWARQLEPPWPWSRPAKTGPAAVRASAVSTGSLEPATAAPNGASGLGDCVSRLWCRNRCKPAKIAAAVAWGCGMTTHLRGGQCRLTGARLVGSQPRPAFVSFTLP